MSDNLLIELSVEFAVKIVRITDQIQGRSALKNQTHIDFFYKHNKRKV